MKYRDGGPYRAFKRPTTYLTKVEEPYLVLVAAVDRTDSVPINNDA